MDNWAGTKLLNRLRLIMNVFLFTTRPLGYHFSMKEILAIAEGLLSPCIKIKN